ncbi:MAG: hypothetical protein PHU08_00980 [Dehalococcoidales bacterium]|nr:hypothetical protein [Dehalococcoidales bacterium]
MKNGELGHYPDKIASGETSTPETTLTRVKSAGSLFDSIAQFSYFANSLVGVLGLQMESLPNIRSRYLWE